MWLPSVITSTPAANSSSACLGVIPMPPAAFSPLATTKSSANSSRSPGSSSLSVRRPGGGDDVADEEDGRHALHATRRVRAPASRERILRVMRASEPDTAPDELAGGRAGARDGRGGAAAAAARRRPSRRPRSRRSWCRAGSSSSCCRSRCSALWALARAAGPVLLIFIIAGLIALLLNPFVTLLRRAHFPRGAAVGDRVPRAAAGRGRHRRAARRPDRQPGVRVPRQRADDRRRRQRLAGRLPGLARPQRRSTSRSPSPARPPSTRSATASPRARASSSPSPATRCCGWWRRRSG